MAPPARMSLLLLLLLLLAAAGAMARAGASDAAAAPPPFVNAVADAAKTSGGGARPHFCLGLECPEYDLLETAGDVELRRYKRAAYVTTRVEAPSLLAAQIEGAKRLLAYFAGDNDDGAVLLPPTLPLETILFPADGRAGTVKGHFCVAMYIPRRCQDKPPAPNDRRVRVVRARGASDWFVLRVKTGFIDEAAVIRRTWDFIFELERTRGRCAVERGVASFGVYELPVPFWRPGYFEVGVPRRRRGRCADGEGEGGEGGGEGGEGGVGTEGGTGGEGGGGGGEGGGGGDPGAGGGGDDFGVDACEVCGECADGASVGAEW